ncbi:MAG TPA: hypothetical protein DIW30_02450, partial [Bacteroidales bacterium]|nr:hypothetical protein [Bacteroidales bacterium]
PDTMPEGTDPLTPVFQNNSANGSFNYYLPGQPHKTIRNIISYTSLLPNQKTRSQRKVTSGTSGAKKDTRHNAESNRSADTHSFHLLSAWSLHKRTTTILYDSF